MKNEMAKLDEALFTLLREVVMGSDSAELSRATAELVTTGSALLNVARKISDEADGLRRALDELLSAERLECDSEVLGRAIEAAVHAGNKLLGVVYADEVGSDKH